MSAGWEAGVNWGLLILRLGVGLIFITHGYPKMAGKGTDPKVNRQGLENSIRRLGLPFPHEMAIVVGTIQFVGGLMLWLGLGTRLAAFSLAVIMLVAATRNFVEKQFLGSADWPFSLLTSLLALLLTGGGTLSLDWLLF
ncbi:MAG: DoxX family protein [Deltaproteobacteria bacterium]|nr:DoxX family protein [Deltaproteobacteria bacterium]